MDIVRFLEIKDYVGFGQESARALYALHARVADRLPRVAEDFYDAVQRDPKARGVFTGGRPQIDRLKLTLRRWLDSVLTGPHDADYLERHSKIGEVHVSVALPQELMLTAMNRIRTNLLRLVEEDQSGDPGGKWRTALAINQVLDLELAVMLDSYREDSIRQALEVDRLEVVEAVPAFVLALDSSDKIRLWNRRLEAVTGFDRKQMIGKPGRELVGSEPNQDRMLAVSKGGHRLVRWHTAPSHHGLTYAIGVDVTLEAEMQRRARRAERLAAVGTLAAGLAHEVRNPLNSATLQLQVLKRRIERGGIEEDQLMPVCDVVLDELSRLDRLVKDFLDFARPKPLDTAPLDLNRLVDSVLLLFGPVAEAAQVKLDAELDPALEPVLGDAERLRQVLLNLLQNGIEAARDSGSRVCVATRRSDAEGFVTVELSDDGSGFQQDAPIFDAFYTTKDGGTGLGLAIVHRIVADHGGDVSVKSQPGNTRFSVRLPASFESLLASTPSPRAEP